MGFSFRSPNVKRRTLGKVPAALLWAQAGWSRSQVSSSSLAPRQRQQSAGQRPIVGSRRSQHSLRADLEDQTALALMNAIASPTVTRFSTAWSGDLDIEFLFKRHRDLENIQAIGPQIADELGVFGNPRFFGSEVHDDDFSNPFSNIRNHARPRVSSPKQISAGPLNRWHLSCDGRWRDDVVMTVENWEVLQN
jgi:hypothetical protein